LIQGFAQQYGRFEVRARLPKTPGSWPAHWLMPHGGTRGWPGDGEIDIMESFHGRVQRVAFTLHWDDQGHQQKGIGCALNWGRNFSEDFHVFAIEWEPNEIRWYVDDYLIGKLKSSEKNRRGSRVQIPSLPFYWILNSSISTDGVDPRTFPVGKHYIDYVRVYRRR
jgi:beta-glucanase (GH16 family)